MVKKYRVQIKWVSIKIVFFVDIHCQSWVDTISIVGSILDFFSSPSRILLESVARLLSILYFLFGLLYFGFCNFLFLYLCCLFIFVLAHIYIYIYIRRRWVSITSTREIH
jgi:TRAP-type C4-dicarboxylate transport system permease small subunit